MYLGTHSSYENSFSRLCVVWGRWRRSVGRLLVWGLQFMEWRTNNCKDESIWLIGVTFEMRDCVSSSDGACCNYLGVLLPH